MSDISKCQNGCKKQLLCKRWTAPAHSQRQSYMNYEPNPDTGECDSFLGNAVYVAGINHIKE